MLEQLAELSPVVQALPPSAALVELKGALRYHGVDARRVGEVPRVRTISRLGVDMRVGIGPSITVAALRTAAGEPVAELEALSFQLRFGAVAVAAEGIGGVETQPEFRRQGHMSRLLRQALAGMAQRVDVVFVSNGIEGVYEQFGFVGAVAEGHLVIPVRNVEQAAGDDPGTAVPGIRSSSPADLPAMIRMYNTAHAQTVRTVVGAHEASRKPQVRSRAASR